MIFDLILGSAILVALIAFYFENNTATKAKNGVLLGVTLPYSEIKNKNVLQIVEEYKKGNKIFALIGIIVFFPIVLIKYLSLKMIYLFIWIFFMELLSYKLFDKYNKRLKILKIENKWFISQTRLLTIDTEVTRLKDKMPVSALWFIPSIIISLIPIAIVVINKNFSFGLLISASTGFIGTVIFIIVYRVYCKKPTEIYSEDSKVNIAYNLIYKRMWTMGTVVAATVQSIGMLFIFLPMTLNSNSTILLILSAIVPATIIFVGIYYINNKVTEEQNRLINTSNNPIYVDNDEYWFRDIYNNPNDRRYIVEPRVGYKMTYNLGTKKGRRIFYGMYIFVAILLVGISIMTLRLDFSKMKIVINNEVVKIETPSYGFDFNIDQIEEVKMVDSIKVNIRTNGAATDKYSIGYFDVEGYGNCRLYIYDKKNPYIMVKVKDEGYIFIAGTSKEETERYYEEFIKNVIR